MDANRSVYIGVEESVMKNALHHMSSHLIFAHCYKSAVLIGALVFIFTPQTSTAETLQPAAFAAEIGVSALRFNYAEHDADATLDSELGGIPGLSIRLTQRLSDWEWEERASYLYGRINYAGYVSCACSSNGAPINTNTDEVIGDMELRLGRWFEGGYPVMPYVGLGYRRWDRTILPVGNVSGLFESYRWQYASLGAKLIAYQQGSSSLMLDFGWIRPLNPVMYLDANNSRFDLGRRNGLRLMLTSRMSLAEDTTLTLEPYFEYWQLGSSPRPDPTVPYEPESETRNLGLNLRLGKVF